MPACFQMSKQVILLYSNGASECIDSTHKANAAAENGTVKRCLFLFKIQLLNSGIFMGPGHRAITDVPALQYQRISGKQVSFALLDPSGGIQGEKKG